MIHDELLQKMYEQMILIRKFETKALEGMRRGKVFGSLHTGVGQEGLQVGIANALDKDDWAFLSHREHGVLLCRGLDPKEFMAELYAKKTGTFGGKAGSVHIADLEHNCKGTCAILGGSTALATGAAFANKYNGEKRATIVVFGEGASNEGYVYESMNLASIWELPIIFILVNNKYAISSPIWTTTKTKSFTDRATAFQIPSTTANGMDPVEVYEKMIPALEYVRSGKGPYFMEINAYRYNPHSGSDNDKLYRTPDEVKWWRQKDPIMAAERMLREKDLLDDAKIKAINDKIDATLDEAVEFAKNSPDPDLDEVYTNVYSSEVTL